MNPPTPGSLIYWEILNNGNWYSIAANRRITAVISAEDLERTPFGAAIDLIGQCEDEVPGQGAKGKGQRGRREMEERSTTSNA